MCLQWNDQQLYLHADGVRQFGSKHLAAKPKDCESPGPEVLLEEHVGGCPHHPQTWLLFLIAAHRFCYVLYDTVGFLFSHTYPCTGIVHSDLKPANFVIVNASLKLIDFGIANRIQPDVTSIMKDSQVWNFFFFLTIKYINKKVTLLYWFQKYIPYLLNTGGHT